MPTSLRFLKIERRFSAKTERSGRHLLWTGSLDGHGYGQLWAEGRVRVATHVAWFLKHKRWPKKCVLHKCDIPACVNWRCLFEGTKRDNTRDMLKKGRHSHGLKHSRTLYKFSDDQVREIRRQHARGDTQRKIAKRFDVVQSTIHWIVVGKRYAEVV